MRKRDIAAGIAKGFGRVALKTVTGTVEAIGSIGTVADLPVHVRRVQDVEAGKTDDPTVLLDDAALNDGAEQLASAGRSIRRVMAGSIIGGARWALGQLESLEGIRLMNDPRVETSFFNPEGQSLDADTYIDRGEADSEAGWQRILEALHVKGYE